MQIAQGVPPNPLFLNVAPQQLQAAEELEPGAPPVQIEGQTSAAPQLPFTETASKMRRLGWVLIALGILLAGATIWGSIAFNASYLGATTWKTALIACSGAMMTIGAIVLGIIFLKKHYWNDKEYRLEKHDEANKILREEGYDEAIKARESAPPSFRDEVISTPEIDSYVVEHFKTVTPNTFAEYVKKYGSCKAVTIEQQYPIFHEFLKSNSLTTIVDSAFPYVDNNGLMAKLNNEDQALYNTLIDLKNRYLQARSNYRAKESEAMTEYNRDVAPAWMLRSQHQAPSSNQYVALMIESNARLRRQSTEATAHAQLCNEKAQLNAMWLLFVRGNYPA